MVRDITQNLEDDYLRLCDRFVVASLPTVHNAVHASLENEGASLNIARFILAFNALLFQHTVYNRLEKMSFGLLPCTRLKGKLDQKTADLMAGFMLATNHHPLRIAKHLPESYLSLEMVGFASQKRHEHIARVMAERLQSKSPCA